VLSAECGEPRPFAARPSDALGSPIPEHWDWGPRSRPGFRVPSEPISPLRSRSLRCSRLKTGKPLTPKDLWISHPSRNVPFRSGTFRFVPFGSGTFRNFPFRSVLFRPISGGSERTSCCPVPGAELGVLSAECGVRRVPLGTHFPSSFAWLAAQNRKCIVPQGLTDFGPVAKRSDSFRNFPKLSVSFRFVPSRSIGIPGGSGGQRGLPLGAGRAWLGGRRFTVRRPVT